MTRRDLVIEALEKEAEVAWALNSRLHHRLIRWHYFTIGALALALMSFATNWMGH